MKKLATVIVFCWMPHVPVDRKTFMTWYNQQTQWCESHDYNDPNVPTSELRAWFHEMIKTFPPMNGSLVSEDVDDAKLTDYCLGRSIIYAAFALSQATLAYHHAGELAAKYRVGFLMSAQIQNKFGCQRMMESLPYYDR